jgi:dGTPase
MANIDRSISVFLFENMYRHERLIRIRDRAGLIIRDLFPRLLMAPDLMPAEWARAVAKTTDETRRARLVCDYIAGMTDLYAIAEHQRLFDKTPELRLSAPEAQDAD